MMRMVIIVDILTAGNYCTDYLGCEDDGRMIISPAVQTQKVKMNGVADLKKVLFGLPTEDACACVRCALDGTIQH